MGCWNVRTLLDREGSSRPERRTALVTRELARYNIDIAALSETRLSDEDQLTETGSGYTLFWIGKPHGEKREGGVGFAIRTALVKQLERPCGVNDRIMRLRAPLSCGRYMTIISVYAPTLMSSEESIMSFYQDLRAVITSIPREDKIMLLGDFNARVGKDHGVWNALGRFGIGNVNRNGINLLQLCTEFQLAICNTFFHHKLKHKVTWTHPRSKHGHILDYIITRRRDLRDVCSVRVMRGADCDTDHKMLRAKLKIIIRRKVRVNGVKVPKRIDVSKLQDSDVRKNLCDAFDSLEFDGTWEYFRDQVYATGVDVLGLKMIKHRDWFDDNNTNISQLLETKQSLHKRLLNQNLPNRSAAEESYKVSRAVLQRELRRMKNTWWLEISAEVQNAYNRKDTKRLYSLLRKVFGPQPSSVVPLKSKDGSTLINNQEGIMKRWTEHFADLFFNPSDVDESAIDSIPQCDIIPDLMVLPTLEEVKLSITQVNTGKAPGLDGIPVELLLYGGDKIALAIHAIIKGVWQGSPLPQDWIDAILISLFKGKGHKSVCGDYRGITLLEAVGKIFSRILLNRLMDSVCPAAVSESQCGFRSGRGTTDMIFSARQLQEKCIEQQVPLYQVFVDLTKAFDTINRNALWTILGKLGCPSKFVDLFKHLHRDMKARVNFDGALSEPIAIDNGVKQGDIPAPTLFSIYFAVALVFAFHDCDVGVYIRFRSTGMVFDLRRFSAKSKTFQSLIRELLYADDADLVAHSEEDMQKVMDLLSAACIAFGLTISLTKTKVMFTPAPGKPYVQPNIIVQGTRLDAVDTFVYLGSTISRDGTLDAEMHLRIAKACVAFGKLDKRVWSDRGITVNTKMCVYQTCVTTALLYASETWTTYRHHIKSLERFHQNCLRRILGIKWESLTPDTVVLQRAGCTSIAKQIILSQMRWVGHVVRMDDTRLPKQLFYGELCIGKRPRHKPKKRFKDCIKANLKCMKIDQNSWEGLAKDRSGWRKLIREGSDIFEQERLKQSELKRALRKQDVTKIPDWVVRDLTCQVCGRILLSKAGYVNHVNSHNKPQNQAAYAHALPQQPFDKTCSICSKVCKSAAGLKRHVSVHKDVIPDAIDINLHNKPTLNCHICLKICKSAAGLNSHLRAHGRRNELTA